MDYILFINSNLNFKHLFNKILYILNEDVFGDVVVCKQEQKKGFLHCDLFQLDINMTSDSIKLMEEEAEIKLNVELYMNLFMDCKEVVNKTVYFVGKCLKEFNDNALLLSNGDTPIIKKIKNSVIVDSSKIMSSVDYPFDELNMKYIVGKIDF